VTAAVMPLSESIPPEPKGGLGKIAWHWRYNPKRELNIAFYLIIAFYNVFFIVFFLLTHTQPPGQPWYDQAQIVHWFDHYRHGVLYGFAIMFAFGAFSTASTALITYSIRRMSVSPAFAWAYLLMYSLSALPGMLLMCIALTVGAMRPDRDPGLQAWLYDFGFLSFMGTMGVFLIGSLVWMLAILLDKNRVFPKWFGYLNLCNALTEVVIAPAWIFKRGVFAWNGLIAWWVDMVVFGIYTGCFITQLRNLIAREDFGDGPLPDLPSKHSKHADVEVAA
jgi:hypothetical protein